MCLLGSGKLPVDHVYQLFARSLSPRNINRLVSRSLYCLHKDSVRKIVEEVIDDYCEVLDIPKPELLYTDSAFAAHKTALHHEDRQGVLSGIRKALSGKGRALTCDKCFRVVLLRVLKVELFEDSSRTVTPITSVDENIRFILLHELIHVKLRDSELKRNGTYHTPKFLTRFNVYAGKLGVVEYRRGLFARRTHSSESTERPPRKSST